MLATQLILLRVLLLLVHPPGLLAELDEDDDHSWKNVQTQQTRLCYFTPFAALIFGQYNGCLLFILGLCKKT